MTRSEKVAYREILEALEARSCISSFTMEGDRIEPIWLAGGQDYVVSELLNNRKPFGLKSNLRGYLMLVLPETKRKEIDKIALSVIGNNP